MKKTLSLYLKILAIGLVLVSCKDEDKTAFDIHTKDNNVSPYVRVNLETPTVDSSKLKTSSINATISAPANNVAKWTSKVAITGSISTDTVEIASVSSFPSTISIKIEDIAKALNIMVDNINPADKFVFIGQSTGTDGKTVEFKDLAGDLSGQPEQKQAYNFSVIVFCAPVASNFVGDWKLAMNDSWGDGWNGGYILATIDGKESKYFAEGSSTTLTVTIPSGTTSLVWSYHKGSYEDENSFTITDPSGTSYGPFNGGGSGIPFCFMQ